MHNRKRPHHRTYTHIDTCIQSHNICNLSNASLSTHEISLLNKGLSFIPKPKKTNTLELYSDIQSFVRKLRLHYIFHNKPRKDKQPFEPKSKYNPGVTPNDALETNIEKLKTELTDLKLTQTKCDNLTRNKRLAMSNLAKRTDIVINKADKGSTSHYEQIKRHQQRK